jgi:metallophosphoesterase (TIGR00282 family)
MSGITTPVKGSNLRILFLGDVVGRPGREAVAKSLRAMRGSLEIDLVVANGENAAGGAGIDAGTAAELRTSGVDVITLGDHAFQRKGALDFLAKNSTWCIRPFNLPEQTTPGKGWCCWTSPSGTKVFVCNVIGRVFMSGGYDCPFRGIDRALQEMEVASNAIVLCDVHAEATSEKWSMARYVDGRISLLVGTHTHVQTSDAQILPGGTGYLTDLGMTGCPGGVIGMASHVAMKRFLSPTPAPYEIAEGDGALNGVLADIDTTTGKARWIQLVSQVR